MNSVSMPSRPVSRARWARSVTVVSTMAMEEAMLRAAGRTARRRARSGRRTVRMVGLTAVLVRMLRLGCGLGQVGRRGLVGPVAVGAVEVARLVLGVALALALDADAEDHVQQPDGQPGADDARAALDPGLAAAGGDDDDQAAGDDRHREPDPDEAHPHRAASALGARRSGEKRVMRSAGVTASPGSLSPTDAASSARTSSAVSPSAARSASVTAPWRLASRAPSSPSISGTWAWRGAGSPRRSPSQSWRGVESNRSAPRTTSPIPCAASSTTTARLYAYAPSLRRTTKSSTTPLTVPATSSSNVTLAAPARTRSAGGRPSARRAARSAGPRRRHVPG